MEVTTSQCGLFDIEDFTCATPWESLIAGIEGLLETWGLRDGGMGDARPQDAIVPSANVDKFLTGGDVYVDRHDDSTGVVEAQLLCEMQPYLLSFYFHGGRTDGQLQEQNRSDEDDESRQHFSLPLHELVRQAPAGDFMSMECHELRQWYGLRRYLVIRPQSDRVVDESEATFLLSTLCIAAQHVNCVLGEHWSGLYVGRMSYRGMTLRFDVLMRQRAPKTMQRLSGLEEYFIENTRPEPGPWGPIAKQRDNASSSAAPLTRVKCSIAVRFLYQKLRESWQPLMDPYEFGTLEDYGHRLPRDLPPRVIIGGGTINEVRWGVSVIEADPITNVELSANWPYFPQGALVDNAVYTDLNPNEAPFWAIECIFEERTRVLTETIEYVLHAWSAAGKLSSIEEKLRSAPTPIELISSLNQTRQGSLWAENDPLANALAAATAPPRLNSSIGRMIKAIFERCDANTIDCNWLDDLPGLKGAPYGSLLSLLVDVLLEQAQHEKHALRPDALLKAWRMFCSHIRRRFQRREPLSGFDEATPNLRFCVLHQKLQVIAHAIQLDILRTGQIGQTLDGIDHEKSIKGMLLAEKDVPLYFPLTQETRSLTEDQIEEQHAIFQRIGSGAEATRIRSEMQTSSLLSDMQAFKFANPEGKFEDFVRFYSPNDWIVDCDGPASQPRVMIREGFLSARMADPDNLWARLWNNAEAIPAAQQEPLFDHNKEAERAIDFISTISPADLVMQLTAVCLGNVVCILRQSIGATMSVPLVIDHLNMFATVLNSSHLIYANKAIMVDVITALSRAESTCSRASSLLGKFPQAICLCQAMLTDSAPHQLARDDRNSVRRFFDESKTKSANDVSNEEDSPSSRDIDLPEPTARQFCIVGCTPMPYETSRLAAHRLFVSIAPDEFLLATAWGESEL